MDRRFRTYIILMVCLLMQAVAVFPHHHHAHSFCLHDDWEQCEGCEHDHHNPDAAGEQHKCEDGCVTHILCRTQEVLEAEVVPDSFITFLTAFADTFRLTGPDDRQLGQPTAVYIEHLHAVPIRSGKGLRAPPQIG